MRKRLFYGFVVVFFGRFEQLRFEPTSSLCLSHTLTKLLNSGYRIDEGLSTVS